MTIHLETEVVSSSEDKLAQTFTYTIARDGRRWTVTITAKELNAFGASKEQRRNHLAKALSTAMQGPPDPPAGTKEDPERPETRQDFTKIESGKFFVNPADGKTYVKP